MQVLGLSEFHRVFTLLLVCKRCRTSLLCLGQRIFFIIITIFFMTMNEVYGKGKETKSFAGTFPSCSHSLLVFDWVMQEFWCQLRTSLHIMKVTYYWCYFNSNKWFAILWILRWTPWKFFWILRWTVWCKRLEILHIW